MRQDPRRDRHPGHPNQRPVGVWPATIYIFMFFAGELSTAIGELAKSQLDTRGLLAAPSRSTREEPS